MSALDDNSQLIVVQIPSGPIETNAFLAVDPGTREALIVDAPPESLAKLEDVVAQHGAKPVLLVLTHTHWDHIGDMAAVCARYEIPLAVHDLEQVRVTEPAGGPAAIAAGVVGRALNDGDIVAFGERELRVMHTPGHSPGQISLYGEQDHLMFGGDTLFPNGYGRVDIPGASEADTVATMRRLLELPDDVTVLTGHGQPTTIGRERPWMERVAETGELL
jgi:hydroxyacylglutathione hydrolase